METFNFMSNTNICKMLITLLISINLFIGCGDDEYTLHLTIEGKGTVYLNNAGYQTNKAVTFEAHDVVIVGNKNTIDDWEFVEYTGDLTGNSSYEKLTMDSDKHFSALFSLKNSVQVNGAVYDSDKNALEGVVIYSEPGANSVSGVTDSNGQYSISNVPVPSTSKQVYLLFVKNGFEIRQYYFYKNQPIMHFNDITLLRTYNLEVHNDFYNKGSTAPIHKTYTLTENDVKTLSATTYSNTIAFENWSGDVPISENVISDSISVTMDKNRTIYANFKQLTTFTIQVHPNDDTYGTVSQIPEGLTQSANTNIKLSCSPEDGYVFSYWLDHNGQIFSTNALTFLLNEDTEYTCVFNKTAYQLTIEKTGEGSYRVDPPSDTLRFLKDTKVAMFAIPASGWHFRNWQQDTSVNSNQQIDIVMDSDKTVSLVFEWPYALFCGQVTENTSAAISNVKVMVGAQSTLTDIEGYFDLKVDIPKNVDTMTILFQKQGYCLNSKRYSVQDQIKVNVYPILSKNCNVLLLIIQTLQLLSGQNVDLIGFDIDGNDQPGLSEVIFMLQHVAE